MFCHCAVLLPGTGMYRTGTTWSCRDFLVYRFVRRHVLTSNGRFETYALPNYYAARSGDFLLTLRDDLTLKFSGDKNAKETMWPIGGPETSVRYYHYSLRNDTYERICDLLGGGRAMSNTGCCVLKQKNGRCIERDVSEGSSCVLDWKFYCWFFHIILLREANFFEV